MNVQLSRRGFLAGTSAVAGAFALGFHLPRAAAQSAPGVDDEVSAWLLIHPDESVVIRISRSEMGQGSMTGLAQLLAEELECDWANVGTEFVLPGNSQARAGLYGDFQTGGSGSIRELHETMRQAGATARQMLVSAAAAAWDARPEECAVAAGVISHTASGRVTTYGKVAAAAAQIKPGAVELKDPRDWHVAGKPLRRLEATEKVVGKAEFGIDVALPSMLNAAIRMCPNAGGRLASFDAGAVEARRGVRGVVQIDETAVVVVADTWWQAEAAVDAMPIVWDQGPNTGVSSASIAAMLDAGLEADESFAGLRNGDAAGALNKAAKTVVAKYSFPYQAHAALEPINATALYTTERCEVWASTQDAGAALEMVVEASGLPAGQCEVNRTFLGGGFGRRLYSDFVRQAVLIAKHFPGTPVKMIWSRGQDMTHDAYHPTTQAKMMGGLDADGNLSAMHMRMSGQSIRAVWAPHRLQGNGDPHMFNGLAKESFGYAIPNLLIDQAMRNPPILPGAWRGVHLNQNVFYVESFIDEMAHAAGKDPLVFRRSMMAGKPLLLAVLEAAAERIGWSSPPPVGIHRGIAAAFGTESYVAAAAEVSVTNGALKIHRMVCALDCGIAVNPGLIARQLEGGFAFGLSAALFGECTVEAAAVQETNFDGYGVVRMMDMPAVETIVMPSGGFFGGVGEPPVVVAGPAVLNAVFAATGKRIRNLPLKNHDLGSGS
jgi:isoquinoline 1-oxidoreductase beta subunit